MNITYKSLNVLPEFNFLSKSALFVPEVSSCLWISSGFKQNNCNLTNMHKKSQWNANLAEFFVIWQFKPPDCFLETLFLPQQEQRPLSCSSSQLGEQLYGLNGPFTWTAERPLPWQKQCFQKTIWRFELSNNEKIRQNGNFLKELVNLFRSVFEIPLIQCQLFSSGTKSALLDEKLKEFQNSGRTFRLL